MTEQLEALQLAANNAAVALNARGDLLVNCLQDIPVLAREVTLHGVRHGATVTLGIAQVRSRHELQWLQPGFRNREDPNDY